MTYKAHSMLTLTIISKQENINNACTITEHTAILQINLKLYRLYRHLEQNLVRHTCSDWEPLINSLKKRDHHIYFTSETKICCNQHQIPSDARPAVQAFRERQYSLFAVTFQTENMWGVLLFYVYISQHVNSQIAEMGNSILGKNVCGNICLTNIRSSFLI